MHPILSRFPGPSGEGALWLLGLAVALPLIVWVLEIIGTIDTARSFSRNLTHSSDRNVYEEHEDAELDAKREPLYRWSARFFLLVLLGISLYYFLVIR